MTAKVERYPVSVVGVDLVVEQPRGRRGGRFLRGGEELPRDRWGNTLLTGTDGQPHRLEIGYSLLNLSPTVRVDDRRDGIVLMPFSKGVRIMWIGMMLLGGVGMMGGGLLMGGVFAAAGILARHRRGPRPVVAALAVAMVMLAVQILWWTGVISGLFT